MTKQPHSYGEWIHGVEHASLFRRTWLRTQRFLDWFVEWVAEPVGTDSIADRMLRAALVFALLALLLALSWALNGCAGTVALYRDTPNGPKVWQISGATLGSKLPEGSNEMTATTLDDGTWELVMGGRSAGAEAAGIPPEVLAWMLKTALAGMPVPQVKGE